MHHRTSVMLMVTVRYAHGMSVRLQILMDEDEMDELRAIAGRQGMTVSEWVRQSLRAASRRQSHSDPARRLAVIRTAARHAFPTADIADMLAQIETGYLGETR